MKTKYIPLKPALLQSHINPFIDIEIFIVQYYTHFIFSLIKLFGKDFQNAI